MIQKKMALKSEIDLPEAGERRLETILENLIDF